MGAKAGAEAFGGGGVFGKVGEIVMFERVCNHVVEFEFRRVRECVGAFGDEGIDDGVNAEVTFVDSLSVEVFGEFVALLDDGARGEDFGFLHVLPRLHADYGVAGLGDLSFDERVERNSIEFGGHLAAGPLDKGGQNIG